MFWQWKLLRKYPKTSSRAARGELAGVVSAICSAASEEAPFRVLVVGVVVPQNRHAAGKLRVLAVSGRVPSLPSFVG